tara:strand:+ start:293 stop:655 length:363 start_codon:yes stop_codon:yes gene_type:complete
MEHEQIMDCLKEQLGKPVIDRKKVEENKLFILDGIMAGDLPVYRKWVWESMINPPQLKWLFRIAIIEGRLQCDRIKLEDNGRVEFDTNNHSVILDSDFKEATEDEWKNGIHKLMKYLRNE